MSSRNCELRNVLEFGDRATIARLGALVAQSSACLAGVTQDVSGSWHSTMRDARCGLRRIHVGEASNPGPTRRIHDPSKAIIDSLERELTMVDSDEEPLVRPSVGRPQVVSNGSISAVCQSG